MACSAANKQSGIGNGVCGVARLGSNPGNQCVRDAVNPCGSVAACKGTAAECAKAPPGTTCGTTQCVNGNVTGQVCDGQGSCQQNATQSCGLYKCENNACTTPCRGDFDCVSGNYCENGTCVPQSDNGKGCSTTNQCKSGFCVDGVCCDAPCNGQCEACDTTGSLGQCKTVSGAPHGTRAACTGSGGCQGRCNGTDPTVCSFPSSGTSCAPSSCAGDVSQPAGYCDGSGTCTVPATKNCLPFTCDTATGGCKTSCRSDLDCALGAKCDTITSRCAIIGASCKDAYTVQLANGQEQSCRPYQCVGGACLDACTTSADCAPGYQCSAPTCVGITDAGADGAGGAGATSGSGGTAGGGNGGSGGGGATGAGTGGSSGTGTGDAGPPKTPAPDAESGGCGCRTTTSKQRSRGALFALALALALGRRARTRRQGATPA
jgi:MYXO-CTERM domain-containing protein